MQEILVHPFIKTKSHGPSKRTCDRESADSGPSKRLCKSKGTDALLILIPCSTFVDYCELHEQVPACQVPEQVPAERTLASSSIKCHLVFGKLL